MEKTPVPSPDSGVILVASGYLFRCPECSAMSYRSSALEKYVEIQNRDTINKLGSSPA